MTKVIKLTTAIYNYKLYYSEPEKFAADFDAKFDPENGPIIKTYLISQKERRVAIKNRGKYSVPRLNGFDADVYNIDVIVERETWQVHCFQNGELDLIDPPEDGLTGDLYHFMMVPSHNILLGVTAGPNRTMKGMVGALLQDFTKKSLRSVSFRPNGPPAAISREIEPENLYSFLSGSLRGYFIDKYS